MKSITKIINFLLFISGIRKVIQAEIQNKYIVYVKATDSYYNLLPLVIGQTVYYKNEVSSYHKCIVRCQVDETSYVVENGERLITHRDNLYPYLPDEKVKGYIKGIYFVVINIPKNTFKVKSSDDK